MHFRPSPVQESGVVPVLEPITKGTDLLTESTTPIISLNVKDLPSHGVPYPVGARISYRTYEWLEAKQASQSKFDSIQTIDFILKGIETNFDKELLTMGDFLYVGLLRKVSTFGDGSFSAPYICPNCFAKNVTQLKTTDLEFDDIQTPKLPVNVNMMKGWFSFSPMTVRDFKQMINDGVDKDDAMFMAYQCRGFMVNGQAQPTPRDHLYTYFKRATGLDAALLSNIDRLMYHGVKPTPVKCSNNSCGFTTELVLDGGEAILLPFRTSEDEYSKRIESAIHFGTQGEHTADYLR